MSIEEKIQYLSLSFELNLYHGWQGLLLWLTKHLRKISPCVYLHITQAGASVCFNLKLTAKYQQRGTAKNLTRCLNASIKRHSYFLSPAHVTTSVYLQVFTLVFRAISSLRRFGLHLFTQVTITFSYNSFPK